MKNVVYLIIVCGLALAGYGQGHAQQAPPAGYNADLQHLTSPDGSIFQVLTSSGDFDGSGTAAAYNAYVAANPQPTPLGPMLVTKLNFIRLLTSTEQAAFIVAQDEAASLTMAQETASPMPAQTQALIGLKVFLAEYNALQPGDTINLTDPSTVSAVNLLLTLGVIPNQARVTAILAGQHP